MKKNIILLSLIVLLIGCKNDNSTKKSQKDTIEAVVKNDYEPQIEIMPISHATFVMIWDERIFYIDPVGGEELFDEIPKGGEVTLITDIHHDHLDFDTLESIKDRVGIVIAPEAVNEKINGIGLDTHTLHNDESMKLDSFRITAIPMYNLSEDRLKFHEKGRGNGYVIEKNGYKVYISGDTEDIPEMRSLKGINKAFVCMNLPYTMTVEDAADAVLEFEPKEVYPYHYRGIDGFSNISAFEDLVISANENIKVVKLDWYPVED